MYREKYDDNIIIRFAQKMDDLPIHKKHWLFLGYVAMSLSIAVFGFYLHHNGL